MLTEQEKDEALKIGMPYIKRRIKSLGRQAAYAEENDDSESLDILDTDLTKLYEMQEYLISIIPRV